MIFSKLLKEKYTLIITDFKTCLQTEIVLSKCHAFTKQNIFQIPEWFNQFQQLVVDNTLHKNMYFYKLGFFLGGQINIPKTNALMDFIII